ncbi:DUF2141 domain-containing protein [Bacteroidota bacterium]
MLIILIFLLIQTLFAYNLNNDPNKQGSISLKITGFANDNGTCRFALDNSEDVYESDNSVFIGKVLPIINKKVILKIDSLEYGYYAIKVFHDENSNGEIDKNYLGIPTEDYGYSNNVSAWFGPPSWERAKFLFDRKYMTLEISVD